MKVREQVDLNLIDDNPWQPRQTYDQEALQELADSIHSLGLMQVPLGRRTEDGRVQSTFGHRRVRACRLNFDMGRGPQHIEMDIAEISDDDMAVMALTENEARKQLTQVEVVRAHKKAIEETGLTIQALADKLGVNRSTLSNNLRVLDLPDFVLEHVEKGDLSIHVAREFLVLQNDDHAHTLEMQRVVDDISRTWGFRGAPDWSRRHVRKLIFECVSKNENDFRPLGPRGPLPRYTGYIGGHHREANFDVEAFSTERPAKLHTIPNPDADEDKHEGSRVWTCDVKAWRSAQTRATREANKEAVAEGKPTTTGTSGKAPSRDQQFEEALAQDPVWKAIAANREKAGRARPVTDEEREALGTRAELKDVSNYGYGTFFKRLQITDAENVHSWQRDSGGQLPPWFPDLKECQRTCTIGAAYAKERGYDGSSKPFLACFNKTHFVEKLERGLAEYKAKLEEQRVGMDRQDQKAMQKLTAMLELMPVSASDAIADSLLTASRRDLEFQHPLGVSHRDFSYEGTPRATVREILDRLNGEEKATAEESRRMAAALITHHLRAAGTIETLLQAEATTVEAEPQPEEVAVSSNGHTSFDGFLAAWLDNQQDLDGFTATEVLERACREFGNVTSIALSQAADDSTKWQKVKGSNRAKGQVGVMFFRPREAKEAETVSVGNAG